jgi:hypothetical protein
MSVLVDLLGIGLFLLVCWFIMTQMILPALRNTASFPIFRRKLKEKEQVAEEIRGLEAEDEIIGLKQQAAELGRKVEKKRKKVEPKTSEKKG